MQEILEQKGYHVLEVSTGVQALQIWEQRRDDIDLVLTDMMLPAGVSGWELAEKLRAEKPQLKVLCTSGYSLDLAQRNFDAPEGMRFLQRPFKPQSLAQAVRECLDS